MRGFKSYSNSRQQAEQQTENKKREKSGRKQSRAGEREAETTTKCGKNAFGGGEDQKQQFLLVDANTSCDRTRKRLKTQTISTHVPIK